MTEKYFVNNSLKIYYDVYKSENPKGILQVVHGAIEHGRRYKDFAKHLSNNGFTVYVIDLRGHGRSVNGKFHYLSDDNDGWNLYIEEVNKLRRIIEEEYPDKPIFLMGHSMGSFIVRDYISKHRELSGVILSGTATTPMLTINSAIALTTLMNLLMDKSKKSKFVHNLIFGALGKKAKKLGYESFISRDEKVVKAYKEDPLSDQLITLDYGMQFARGLKNIEKKNAFTNTPDQPIYLFSGELDPVGGKKCDGVMKVYKRFINNGKTDIEMKIYDDALHEMINELNKDEVYNDILIWLNKRLKTT